MSHGNMTTAQKLRPTKQETSEWTSLFPNEIECQTQSLVFVKRMMVVALSSITYLRGIFPEHAYRSRYLEGLCIKVLRENSTSTGACKLVKWIMGCFDALEKGYVHRNPDDPNSIIESYQFKIKYTPEGPQMDILSNKNTEVQITMEDTKKASVLLIRKLFLLMQNLDMLPDNVSLTMKLYYYDDVTPADYQPPGFKEGECDSLWFEGRFVNLKMGELQTPFHVLKVRVAAEHGKVAQIQRENILDEPIQVSEKRRQAEQDTALCREEQSTEDDSADFKQPRKTVRKKKTTTEMTKKKLRKREE
ncbi:zebrafish testis-expressed 38 isoform X2 [Lepisosteus oculatus]|uniref:zebrafish testis-expressed 38 isoform X2 n=1 Tax=Lepisosteus oculatus TaxID=7918 RepID=UPI00073FD647|nr:PREDICTED: HORMA domain-containing protein 1-like isoform X2 [Lepisosteus oculatus]